MLAVLCGKGFPVVYHHGRVCVQDFQQATTVRPLFKEGAGHCSAHHLEKVLFTQHVINCIPCTSVYS